MLAGMGLSMGNKAVFLDRDGVINKHRDDYVKNIAEFELVDGVEKQLKLLSDNHFKLIVITNQSMVGRGLSTKKDLLAINDKMQNLFKKVDFQIDRIYCCLHTPWDNCNCRKPRVKLFEKAIEDFDIDVKNSWLIGDNQSDIMAGQKIGCKTILIKANSGLEEAVQQILKDVKVTNF